jgi:iron complex outermembrane receptor protein
MLDMDLGVQRNYREEWSQYVNHGYMPPNFPDNQTFPADLERGFEKYIYSVNLKATHSQGERRDLSLGLNSEYQDNRIDGRGFIIPAFTQAVLGGYIFAKQNISASSIVNLGIRYDFGQIKTQPYSDWFQSPNDDETEWLYVQRATRLDRSFSALSWSVGYNFNREIFLLKANIGKSFRMPIAKELAANGVNYHQFSYEVGDVNLSPEVSYQLDMGAELNTNRFAISVNPFVNYFANYIYLNPTHLHDRLYGNGNQIFIYTEAEVFRFGGEMHAHLYLAKKLKLGIIGEYIYSEQLSGSKKGFSLPFSPAPSGLISLKYQSLNLGFVQNAYLYADLRITAIQNQIVPPEEVTDGYQELNLGLGGEVRRVRISLQINNVFNSKHFNHSSYYRLINVPEPGRNVAVNITVPFNIDITN